MNTEISQGIFQQLGGNRFLAMTGAQDFSYHVKDRKLCFWVPGKINRVHIQLMDDDTYTMTFAKLKSCTYTIVKTVEGLFGDQLASVFENETGLLTELRVKRA